MNTRFSTYASYWIKQSIKRAVINTGKTIRIPAYMMSCWSSAWATAKRRTNWAGRRPRRNCRQPEAAKKKLASSASHPHL